MNEKEIDKTDKSVINLKYYIICQSVIEPLKIFFKFVMLLIKTTIDLNNSLEHLGHFTTTNPTFFRNDYLSALQPL